jgi:hypothetical protein
MNLHQYIMAFIRKGLSADYSAEDIRSEVYLFMVGNAQLRKYAVSNAVPSGRDLSFLKAVIFRTRLREIKKQNRQETGYRDKSKKQLARERLCSPAIGEEPDPAMA